MSAARDASPPLARRLAWELVGYAPLISLYLLLGFQPQRFDDLQRTWLLMVQFPLIEAAAAATTALVAFRLGDGWKVGGLGQQRLATARQRDLGLLLFALATVVVLPIAVYYIVQDATRALGVAGIFLPRALEVWRVRDQSRPVARAVGFAALSGPALIFCFVLLVIFGDAIGLLSGSLGAADGARLAGLLVAGYYVAVAAATAWLAHRAEPWRH